MFGTKRTFARIGPIAVILAMFLMALPINRAPVAFAYAANPVFSDTFMQGTLTEGLQWPDPTNLAADGQVAIFDDNGTNYFGDPVHGPGSACPAMTSFTATVQWGDGQSYPASVYLLGADAGNGNVCQYEIKSHHTYVEEGHYVPVACVQDSADGSTKCATSAGITVADAPLSDTSSPALQQQTYIEGAPKLSNVLATFMDADPGCDRSDYAITVDWGDQSTGNAIVVPDPSTPCLFDITGTHTYVEEGVYQVNIHVIDHNSFVNMTDTITVNDAPLISVGQSTIYGVEGASTGKQLLATFQDTDPGCALYDYHMSINWGDGTPVDNNWDIEPNNSAGTPCTYNVYGTHTYADENAASGPYQGTVTIYDAGTSVPINFTADISDAPLATTVTGTFPGFVEGQTNTHVFIGTFHDTNPNCPTNFAATPSVPGDVYYEYGVSVNWGDGHTDASAPGGLPSNITIEASPSGTCNFDVYGTHRYDEESFSGYAFTAVITDRGGKQTSFGFNIPVADAPLTDVTDPHINGTEGQQLTSITVAQFNDTAGDEVPADCDIKDYTATIDWGDGTTPDTFQYNNRMPYWGITAAGITPAGCTFNVIGTHIYQEEGTYRTVVTVHDSPTDVITMPATIVVGPNTTIIDAPLSPVANPAIVNETEGNPFGSFSGSGGPVTTSLPRLYLGTFNDSAFTVGPPNGTTTSCDIKDYTATIDWGDNATRPAGADTYAPGNPTTETSTTGGIVPATAANGHTGTCNFDVLGSYDYHEAGDYTIHITVVDAGGAPAINWDVPIHVHDAPLNTTKDNQDFTPVEGQPTVSLFPGQPGGLQYLGTFHDADLYCNASDYTITVDWGDGTPVDTYSRGSKYTGPGSDPGGSPYVIPALPMHRVSACDFDVFGRHVYAEESTPGSPYHVTVTIYDDLASDVGVPPANLSAVDLTPPTYIHDNANVSDAPINDVSNGPTLGVDNNITHYEGIRFDTGVNPDAVTGTLVPLGTIQDTDPTPDCNPNDYKVSIVWGDNTGTDNTTGYLTQPTPGVCIFNVQGAHTYAEESEPGTPYRITVTVTDIGSAPNAATITLHPTATILDAPLTAQPGYSYSVIDSTYPYTSVAGQNGSVTGNGPNNPTAACWLLTPCTRLLATFTDTSTTCTKEGETLQQHYTFSIDWGDGSTIDTTSGFATVHGNPANCQYDVYGTHVYTTPSFTAGPDGFTATTTIMDEGGSTTSAQSTLVVATPVASTPNGTYRRFNIAYSYPGGRVTPLYVMSQTMLHYKNYLGYIAHIQFMDVFHFQNTDGLYIPVKPPTGRFTANCSTTYSYSSQCNLTPLSDECSTTNSTTKMGVWWGQYQYKIAGTLYTRYFKTDLVQAGLHGNQDSFMVTMSKPSNPADYVTSTPPVVPVNEVQIMC